MLKLISFEWNRDPQSWHERFRREMINLDTFLNVTVLPYQDLLAIALLHFLAPSILRLVLQRLEFVSSKDDKDLTVEAMFDRLIAHSEPLRVKYGGTFTKAISNVNAAQVEETLGADQCVLVSGSSLRKREFKAVLK